MEQYKYRKAGVETPQYDPGVTLERQINEVAKALLSANQTAQTESNVIETPNYGIYDIDVEPGTSGIKVVGASTQVEDSEETLYRNDDTRY